MHELKLTDKQKREIRREVSKLTDAQAKKLLARYAKALNGRVKYTDSRSEVVALLNGHKHHRVSFSCALNPNSLEKKCTVIDAIDFVTDKLYLCLLKKLIAYVNGDYQFTNEFLKFTNLAELELLLTARGL